MTDITRRVKPREKDDLKKLVANMASGEMKDRLKTEDGRDLAAVLLGRRGGLIGGHARATKLTAEQRKDIAKRAAAARWSKCR